jgi:hypothetical protein
VNQAMLDAQAKALGLECRIPGVKIVQDSGGIATKG